MTTLDQSSAIDLARGLAALAVAAGHLRNHMLPDYKVVADPHLWFKIVAFFSGFGGQAVIVFFVLSGWLVGGALLSRRGQPNVLKHYAVDRISRLWTVLVPVMALNFVLVTTGSDDSMKAQIGLNLFIANLLGLQTIVAGTYGGNYPLWSLANETAYYVLFPVCAIITTALYRPLQRGFAAALATVGLTALLLLKPSIVVYFSIWLIGVAASRIQLPHRIFWVIAPLFVCVCAAFRILRLDNNIAADALIATAFAFMICSLPRSNNLPLRPRLAAVGGLLSSFSFTLYVIHVPLIFAIETRLPGFRSLSDPAMGLGAAVYAAFLVAILLVAFAFSRVTEARTIQVRRILKRLMRLDPVNLPRISAH